MSAGNSNDSPEGVLICLDGKLSGRTDVDIVRQTQNSLEAIRLVQLGARAPLVSRLTGLGKKWLTAFTDSSLVGILRRGRRRSLIPGICRTFNACCRSTWFGVCTSVFCNGSAVLPDC
jgi:hypothetical protein